jgi:hypothetical protein
MKCSSSAANWTAKSRRLANSSGVSPRLVPLKRPMMGGSG